MSKLLLFASMLTLPLLGACGGKTSGDTADDCVEDTSDTASDALPCVGGSDATDSSDSETPGPYDYVLLSDAPPAVVRARIVDESGGLVQVYLADDPARLNNNQTNNTVLLVSQMEEPVTQIQIVLWQNAEVGEWPVTAFEGAPPSSGASISGVIEGVGSQAECGTVAITHWQRTDSPYVMLASGTFEGGLFAHPDDPTWFRAIEEGEFEALRVTTL
jgi:hypothetical protein